jgi:hypothetical protein
MSAPQPETASNSTSDQRPNNNALSRLEELKRGLQRQLKRKPSLIEKSQLDRTALLLLRSEMALRDPKSDANTIVRLSNTLAGRWPTSSAYCPPCTS